MPVCSQLALSSYKTSRQLQTAFSLSIRSIHQHRSLFCRCHLFSKQSLEGGQVRSTNDRSIFFAPGSQSTGSFATLRATMKDGPPVGAGTPSTANFSSWKKSTIWQEERLAEIPQPRRVCSSTPGRRLFVGTGAASSSLRSPSAQRSVEARCVGDTDGSSIDACGRESQRAAPAERPSRVRAWRARLGQCVRAGAPAD